jgi:uncharacterized coiled-coil protein SlyX
MGNFEDWGGIFESSMRESLEKRVTALEQRLTAGEQLLNTTVKTVQDLIRILKGEEK